MSALASQKRPSPPVIKLVECVGILLRIPPSPEKSKYKAPMPSNYDHTVHLLEENYGGYLTEVARMRSDHLSNSVANELFAKILEPGFDYEQAVNDGGLVARDLFNAIQLVMMSLMEDVSRIPIVKTNVLVAVNGSMSSYNALDAGTHVFKHGMMIAMALTVEESHDRRLAGMMKSHLHQDLVRRCKLQYKLQEHCYSVISAFVPQLNDVKHCLVQAIDEHNAHVLVYGLENDRVFGEDGDGGIPKWLVTSPDVSTSVLLTKKCSRARPFPSANITRTYMIYMDNVEDEDIIRATFLKTLLFVRPGDRIILLALVSSSHPYGDGRVERLEMGTRAGMWVDGVQLPLEQPTCPNWNEATNAKISQCLQSLLITSQVEGLQRLEVRKVGSTDGALLSEYAVQEQADIIVIRKNTHIEVLVETVTSAPCSVLVLA